MGRNGADDAGAAAAGGAILNLNYHWKQLPLPKWLVIVHAVAAVAGFLLAILLGPHAAFVVMGSVLAVQALFFGAGGITVLAVNFVGDGMRDALDPKLK